MSSLSKGFRMKKKLRLKVPFNFSKYACASGQPQNLDNWGWSKSLRLSKKNNKIKKKKKNRQLALVLNWTLHFDTLGGRVLIAEKFLDEDKIGPKSTLLTSLNMLVQVDGKERTRDEYRKLLEKQGFVDIQAKQLDSSEGSDAILCRKAWGNNMYYYTLDTVARTSLWLKGRK